MLEWACSAVQRRSQARALQIVLCRWGCIEGAYLWQSIKQQDWRRLRLGSIN